MTGGWSLIGLASTFLIGTYNHRVTVRNNAVFAFASYQLSDLSMICALAFSSGALNETHPLVAAGLVISALLKSSQFPMSSLFARSMEGPTPASALGYAGLSAHVGVVLLTSTMPLWFVYDYARIAVGTIGLITTIDSSLRSKIRSDRKGALANATSATLGIIYIILAMGHADLALLLSFGHAAFRMIQILRAPSLLSDFESLKKELNFLPSPRVIPDCLFRFTWMLRRFTNDYNPIFYLNQLFSNIFDHKPWKLEKKWQWLLTSTCIVISGLPFTPYSHYLEEKMIDLLHTNPFFALMLMAGHFLVSVSLIKIVFSKILTQKRFFRKFIEKEKK